MLYWRRWASNTYYLKLVTLSAHSNHDQLDEEATDKGHRNEVGEEIAVSRQEVTHKFGSNRSEEPATRTISYVGLAVGIHVTGRLSDGNVTDSTAHCPRCGRVGLATVSHSGRHLIVHQGIVKANTLEATDFCEILTTTLGTDRQD